MKTNRPIQSDQALPKADELKEASVPYQVTEEPMVRTQVYLSRQEHVFIQTEASRLGWPMAAVIRDYIDEKMRIPESVWAENPLLAGPVEDASWTGREDGVRNHDHYIYGTPKKWMKTKGQWVETPPVPEDYYKNPEVRRQYDLEVDRWT